MFGRCPVSFMALRDKMGQRKTFALVIASPLICPCPNKRIVILCHLSPGLWAKGGQVAHGGRCFRKCKLPQKILHFLTSEGGRDQGFLKKHKSLKLILVQGAGLGEGGEEESEGQEGIAVGAGF